MDKNLSTQKIQKCVSNWQQEAKFRLSNRVWLNYSSQISRRVIAVIKNQSDNNQGKLAAQIGVSPQHISKILKGRENLTLETIAKLSTALGVELITFPEYKYSEAAINISCKKNTSYISYEEVNSLHIEYQCSYDLINEMQQEIETQVHTLINKKESLSTESPLKYA